MNTYQRTDRGHSFKYPAVMFFFVILFTALKVHAADPDGPELVQQLRCYGCHALEETLLGPSYQAISRLHAGRKDIMVDILAEKIIFGGAGNWGVVPMVPNEHVTPEQARTIARWILNLETKISERK